MNKIITPFIYCIALLCLLSCKTTKDVEITTNQLGSQELEYSKLENALLWKIESSDKSLPNSYLFGTIHMIESKDYFLPTGTQELLESCSEVVFEIDLDDMNSLGAQMSMMNKIFMKDGLSLKDLLSDSDYVLVSDFFKDKGLPMMFVNRIKPLFLSAMTEFDMNSIDMFGKDDSSENAMKSYEMEFYDMANHKGIPVDGLETMDYQLKVFDAIPYETQAKMLVEGVKSQGDDENGSLDELINAYREQNIELLVESIGEEEEFGEFESILLDDRNMNWIPIMKEKMLDKSVFFAVGAGHLAGQMGVIHLLRKEGYLVTPILNK